MKLRDFALERYFAQHEFSAKYLLSSSDCDGLSLSEVLSLATPAEKEVWENQTLGYTESSGLPALREEIAKLYRGVHADEVVVMSPGEVNFILMNVLLEKTDHVICIAPAYQSLYEVVHGIGCELSFWNPTEENNCWHYDPEELKKLFRKNTKLLIINFPHNPTGYLPDQKDYASIVAIAAQHGIHIFSDEMYRLLERNAEDTLTNVRSV
jgi:Aspartate/tyrosine/aromatic aminotransferase